MTSKQYGLILPSKVKNTQNHGTRTLNPLLDSDDELEKDEDEEEHALNWVEASLKKSAGNAGQRSLQRRMLREALEQDATVFQYDEVFDDMKAQQKQKDNKSSVEKKPKYINTIMKHCEKRKLEGERRMERKVQREREEEGNEFDDKESFVTPSYLKKLEELKAAEELERREKILEEMHDVHKHKNFGVFYNHLFKQRIREPEIKQEPPDDDPSEGGGAIQPEATFSKNRTDQRKNIRARMSDDESPDRSRVTVKKEPGVLDEEDTAPRNGAKRKSGYRGTSSDDSRSPERKSGRDGQRGEATRKHRDDPRNTSRRDSPSRERRRDRISEDHKRGQRSSRSRSPKDRSAHRKRDRRDSRSRERGTDSRKKDKAKSDERSRKEKGEDRIKRESDENRKKEDANGAKRKRSVDEDKENKNKSSSKKDSSAPTQSKQTINTTLGATDVNKMKMEDRIKRFLKVFAKRTVGQTYENAVQKYFQRKAERGASI